MLLMEVGDANFKIPMNVLCADDLNFKFEINILASVDQSSKDAILWAFENLNPTVPGLITTDQLFQTYIQPLAVEKSSKAIFRYATTEIAKNRAQVTEEVRTAVLEATKGLIIQVKQVSVSNLEFPPLIMAAQEARAQRQIEIETAKAEGEKKAATAQARVTLARIEANERLLRAQSQADSNRILASSVSPQLLAWRQYEVMEAAAGGANNMFLIPYTDTANKGLDTTRWMDSQGILDAQLLRRMQEAQESAEEVSRPTVPLSFPALLEQAKKVPAVEVETPALP